MRSLGSICVLLLGCSSSSFDIAGATDAATDSATDTVEATDTATNVPDMGTSCVDPPLTPPPCLMTNGTYASQFDYVGMSPSPVKLDATHQHRLSFRMGVDGRVSKFVLRIKPSPAVVAEEYLSVELIGAACGVETLLAQETQMVTNAGEYVFTFPGSTGDAAPPVRAGTALQLRIRTNSFVGYDIYVVKDPIPNPSQLAYSYRALPDGTTFTPIDDVVPGAAVWTTSCGI